MTVADAPRPYLDYYGAHGISPVEQDIRDLAAHFDRRRSLFRFLGLPGALLAGKALLEFGPGSGHNALYTASLGPATYTLVDGNPTGIAETRKRLEAHWGPKDGLQVIHSLIEEFRADGQFDVVFCEGVIPFQRNPAEFAQHVARGARPGGIVVITCIDALSGLGEFARRLVADTIVPFAAPSADRLAILAPVFAPHLETLKGRTRPVTDWIHDNILIPYHGRPFSIAEAIEALAFDFDVYGSSPHFITDWRWHKECVGADQRFNEIGLDAYFSNVANLTDYRTTVPPHSTAEGRELLRLADAVFDLMVEHETHARADALPEAGAALLTLADRLSAVLPGAAEALSAAGRFVLAADGGALSTLEPMRGFFGRGQQYLSFTRRPGGAN